MSTEKPISAKTRRILAGALYILKYRDGLRHGLSDSAARAAAAEYALVGLSDPYMTPSPQVVPLLTDEEWESLQQAAGRPWRTPLAQAVRAFVFGLMALNGNRVKFTSCFRFGCERIVDGRLAKLRLRTKDLSAQSKGRANLLAEGMDDLWATLKACHPDPSDGHIILVDPVEWERSGRMIPLKEATISQMLEDLSTEAGLPFVAGRRAIRYKKVRMELVAGTPSREVKLLMHHKPSARDPAIGRYARFDHEDVMRIMDRVQGITHDPATWLCPCGQDVDILMPTCPRCHGARDGAPATRTLHDIVDGVLGLPPLVDEEADPQ